MRSEKYRQKQESVQPQKDDYWEETQLIFRSRDEFKEEVKQQNDYAERRARAEAYKEYLAMRENPDGNRSSRTERSGRRKRYDDEKIKAQNPILSENKDRDEEREERRAEKQRRKKSANRKNTGRKTEKSDRKSGFSGGDGKLSGGKKKLLLVLLIIAAIIAVTVFTITGILGQVGKIDIDKNNIGIDTQVAKDLKKYHNIALLGVDARDMDDYANCRTDAIIILSIDKKEKEIRQISVYRDTYVHVNEEYGYDKITNVHAYEGNEGTLHALNENLDLNIEDMVIVNWKAVANAIDALGGVEIEVLDSEINELNKYIPETARSIGEEPVKVEKAGTQTLNGVQAVTYSRIRKDAATGDYRRNERMKIMVSATVEKALKHPFKIPKAASASLPQIGTNMGTGKLLSVMMSFVTKDMTASVGWPFDTSGWTAYNGAWVGVPVTLNSNVTELHEEYFAQPGYTPTKKVQDISAEISARTGYY